MPYCLHSSGEFGIHLTCFCSLPLAYSVLNFAMLASPYSILSSLISLPILTPFILPTVFILLYDMAALMTYPPEAQIPNPPIFSQSINFNVTMQSMPALKSSTLKLGSLSVGVLLHSCHDNQHRRLEQQIRHLGDVWRKWLVTVTCNYQQDGHYDSSILLVSTELFLYLRISFTFLMVK